MNEALYHITPRRNAISILQRGLQIRSGHRGLGLSDIEFLEGGGIHLVPHLEDVLALAHQSPTERRHWAVFKVHLPTGTRTYTDIKAGGGVIVMDDISPKHLELVGYYDTKTEETSVEAPRTYYRGPTPRTREATRKRQQELRELTKAYQRHLREGGAKQ